MVKKDVSVSVIIPIRNEERYIKKCLESLMNQDFSKNDMEIIFVDGLSEDRTVEILTEYIEKYSGLISVLENKNKTVPYGMNIGIKKSKGKFIIRMDAHSEYNNDYISKCVYFLNNTKADNVGGVAETKSKGFVGKAIAMMLSSPFGVGNSSFRINGKDGYVDTVPFGAFKRDVFDKYGFYDERLTRNQDNEMNYRIRKNGGLIYLSNDIKLTYYSRDTLKGIGNMAFKNGMWNIITYYLCPGSMSVRHFIPLVFVTSIIGSIIFKLIFWNSVLNYFFLFEFLIYILIDLVFAIKIGKENGLKFIPVLLLLFPYFHIIYGIGSIWGILKIFKDKIFK
ncbi:glycosyltransferase family 2 protein [Clostridium perfringens]|uniref:glycosyltransferase family 2 protein n=1 Tax=Clostridium perfringens TaxID=1502 RepID=UPI001A1B7FF3|nr:glycosyltransferase family 2 protein [Clostridium perfringens]